MYLLVPDRRAETMMTRIISQVTRQCLGMPAEAVVDYDLIKIGQFLFLEIFAVVG